MPAVFFSTLNAFVFGSTFILLWLRVEGKNWSLFLVELFTMWQTAACCEANRAEFIAGMWRSYLKFLLSTQSGKKIRTWQTLTLSHLYVKFLLYTIVQEKYVLFPNATIAIVSTAHGGVLGLQMINRLWNISSQGNAVLAPSFLIVSYIFGGGQE